jgi:hypothetical protein
MIIKTFEMMGAHLPTNYGYICEIPGFVGVMKVVYMTKIIPSFGVAQLNINTKCHLLE